MNRYSSLGYTKLIKLILLGDAAVGKTSVTHRLMNKEFSDPKQRAAVCYSKWKKAEGTIEITMVDSENQNELPIKSVINKKDSKT